MRKTQPLAMEMIADFRKKYHISLAVNVVLAIIIIALIIF